MSAPDWVRYVAANALISRDELVEWLGIDCRDILPMIRNHGLPPPRIRSIKMQGHNDRLPAHSTPRITSKARWRAGEVRAWVAGHGGALKPEDSR